MAYDAMSGLNALANCFMDLSSKALAAASAEPKAASFFMGQADAYMQAVELVDAELAKARKEEADAGR